MAKAINVSIKFMQFHSNF